jgi:hypothetical protein
MSGHASATVIGSTDELNHEAQIGGLVHEFQPIIGAVGEQVLDPGPALAMAIEDKLRPG